MMTIRVNGQWRDIPEGLTVGDLIAELGVAREGIAVARNDDVVARREIDATALHAGDTIEIIAAVAGG
jgi:sulfur carrier protein